MLSSKVFYSNKTFFLSYLSKPFTTTKQLSQQTFYNNKAVILPNFLQQQSSCLNKPCIIIRLLSYRYDSVFYWKRKNKTTLYTNKQKKTFLFTYVTIIHGSSHLFMSKLSLSTLSPSHS